MKNNVLKYGLAAQAVLIVFLSLLCWRGAGRSETPAGGTPKADDVVVSVGRAENEPTVIDIPRLEDGQEYRFKDSDPSAMRVCLGRRLENAGITLSGRYLDMVCDELENEAAVAAFMLQWVRYREFDLLVLWPPDRDSAGYRCFVFEDNRYKGYIASWGYINTKDCIIEFEDELWLITAKLGHGSGFSCEDRIWYRLTSTGLDREMQYTKTLRKNQNGIFQVSYDEEFVRFEQDEQGGIRAVTKWTETVGGGEDGTLYTFQRTGEMIHSLDHTRLWDTYEMKSDLGGPGYVIEYRAEFLDLIRNGSSEQQKMLRSYLEAILQESDLEAFRDVSELVHWYGGADNAQPQ